MNADIGVLILSFEPGTDVEAIATAIRANFSGDIAQAPGNSIPGAFTQPPTVFAQTGDVPLIALRAVELPSEERRRFINRASQLLTTTLQYGELPVLLSP